MDERSIALLIFVGLALILTGCPRPLDVATATANAAAITMRATRAELVEARKADQLEAAGRVTGDRNDPAVKAEQLDRAAAVGERFKPAFDAYDVARSAWVALVAAIRVARQLEGAGAGFDAGELAALLAVLAKSQRDLLEAAELVAGVLSKGLKP